MIVYFKNVVQAFKARWLQLGGKVVDQESYQDPTFGGNNVQNAVTRLNNVEGRRDRHVDRGRVRRTRAVHHGTADARQQHADPQLVGR